MYNAGSRYWSVVSLTFITSRTVIQCWNTLKKKENRKDVSCFGCWWQRFLSILKVHAYICWYLAIVYKKTRLISWKVHLLSFFGKQYYIWWAHPSQCYNWLSHRGNIFALITMKIFLALIGVLGFQTLDAFINSIWLSIQNLKNWILNLFYFIVVVPF
jgi:hypothetical protein